MLLVIFSVLGGVLLENFRAAMQLRSARETARKILEESEKEGEAQKREAILEAKEEALRIKNELEREIRERRKIGRAHV